MPRTQPETTARSPTQAICQIGLICCAVSLVKPTTCLKSQGKICCVVQSCAFPTDKEIPMTCAFAGIACKPKMGICVKLSECRGGAPSAPDAPHSMEMSRDLP